MPVRCLAVSLKAGLPAAHASEAHTGSPAAFLSLPPSSTWAHRGAQEIPADGLMTCVGGQPVLKVWDRAHSARAIKYPPSLCCVHWCALHNAGHCWSMCANVTALDPALTELSAAGLLFLLI